MTTPEDVRRRRSGLAAVLGTPVVAGYAVSANWPLHQVQGWTSLLVNVAVATTYFAAGAVILAENEHGATGTAVLAAGLLWPLNWVNEWHDGWWPMIAQLQGPLAQLPLVWALLRYPRRWRNPQRDLQLAALLIGIQLLWMTTVVTSVPVDHGLPAGTAWVTLWADSTYYRVVTAVCTIAGAVLAPAVVVGLTVRTRGLTALDRQAMTPVVTAIWLAGGLLALSELVSAAGFEEQVRNDVYLIQTLSLTAIPAAYLLAALSRRAARVVLPDLLADLQTAADPRALQERLRRYLDDPTLTVRFRVGDRGDPAGYVDADGAPALPPEVSRTGWVVESRSGRDRRPIALVDGDPGLHWQRQLMRAVIHVLALVLDNDLLAVVVDLRIAEVARSTDRIRNAVGAEQRRFVTEVSGSVQARLAVLATQVDALRAVGDPRLADIVDVLCDQLTGAGGALTDLVTGQHHRHVDRVGLAAALRETARDLGGSIVVDADDVAPPGRISAELHLVASELMVNAIKHAQADGTTVRLRQTGSETVLVVADDGVGGADPQGSGLAGLADRVRRLRGAFDVLSAPGAGTTVVVRLPVAVPSRQAPAQLAPARPRPT